MVNNVELSEIALLLNGDRSSNYPSDADFISYGVPFVNTGHLSDGKIDYSRVDYISKAKANSLSGAKIVAEDILLCLRGTLGKYAFVEKDGGAPASSLVVIRANKDKIVPRFLYYVVSSNIFQHQILIENNGSSQPNLSAKSVMGFRVPFPTKKEQQAVSNVLSDIDALIENLEKLISKKKAIKQGAMQELLTGKRRLPGFVGEWKNRTIKESCSRVGVGLATSVTQYYRTSGTVIFRNLNIKPNYLDDSDILYLDTDFAMSNPSKIIHTGDVLTVHTGYVGISCIVPPKYDGALTFTTLISTTKPDVLVPEYLAYHLNSDLGHAEIENLQAGGGRNNLNVADFVQYSMVLPVDINEQKAIVNILIDMDREISEYESKLEKYNHIKQGMMSELLTGRIRLIDKEDV